MQSINRKRASGGVFPANCNKRRFCCAIMDMVISCWFAVLVILSILSSSSSLGQEESPTSSSGELLTVTVATEYNDALRRFLLSAKQYGHHVRVLGLNNSTISEIARKKKSFPKVFKNFLLRDYLEQANLQYSNQLILFVDSNDILLLDTPQNIVKLFRNYYPPPATRILYSGTLFCSPDDQLEKFYPKSTKGPFRFINTGSIMAYASDLYDLLSKAEVTHDKFKSSDQIYHARTFINKTLREKYGMQIDYEQKIFVVLNARPRDICRIKYDEKGEPYLYNKMFNTTPVIPHGAGVAKHLTNIIANYFLTTTTPYETTTRDVAKSFAWKNKTAAPRIVVGAVYKEELEKSAIREILLNMDYPKNRMRVNYIKLKPVAQNMDQQFDELINDCTDLDCRFVFMLDATAKLYNATLAQLVGQKRTIIAPLLTRFNYKTQANFVGFKNNFRNQENKDIIERKRIGEWHVSCASSAVLIRRDYLSDKIYPKTTMLVGDDTGSKFQFCQEAMDNFVYVTNTEKYGNLN